MNYSILLKGNQTHFVLFRFLLIGCLLATTYVVVCTILASLFSQHRFLISVCVHCALVPTGFALQRNVAFRSVGIARWQFLRYAGLQVFSITSSSALLIRLLSDSPILNAVIFTAIAGLAAIISFLVCKLFVFS